MKNFTISHFQADFGNTLVFPGGAFFSAQTLFRMRHWFRLALVILAGLLPLSRTALAQGEHGAAGASFGVAHEAEHAGAEQGRAEGIPLFA